MSHIKDRLNQLKNEVESAGDGAYFSKNNISKIVELLLADLEQDEKENGWIPVDEKLPDPDEYILVSFEDFPIPMIGIYTVDDDDGGTFRISDEDDSFLEYGLYVNAWMELPKRYKEGRL
jgi:hypothetical protein